METEKDLMSGVAPKTALGPLKNETLLLAACGTTLATLIPVALFQTKVISELPDPSLNIFDSKRITSSKIAHPLGVPDALLGLASFATTLMLILLARQNRTARLLLGGKLTLDASAAAFNATRQIVSFGKLCSWCTGTALGAGVMAYAGRGTISGTWVRVLGAAETKSDSWGGS